MSEPSTSAPAVENPSAEKTRHATDPVVGMVLPALLIVAIAAWWNLSARIGSLAENVSGNIVTVDAGGVGSADPLSCWLVGVSFQGEQKKMDTLLKADQDNECIRQALRGAEGLYPAP